jgi:uncharacterized coiled-coil DUF342 family protein
MSEENVTVVVLKQIRDEARKTNERLDRSNERLDQVVREQIRLCTGLVALRKDFGELRKDFGELRKDFGELRKDFGEFKEEVVLEVRKLGGRIENLILGPMGTQVRDHEGRLRRIERVVGLGPRRGRKN